MKSLRRTIILIIFLLVSVASMATGVFAWFIDYGNAAHVGEFNQTVQSDNDIVQVNPNEQEIFLGDTIRDLVHLNDYEFNIPGFDFYGHSSVIKMSITNPNPDPNHVATVRLSLRAIAAPEFQQYDGYTAKLYR